MNSPHGDCVHHENHTSRIKRNELDIQDLFKLHEKTEDTMDKRHEKTQASIMKIVSTLTGLGIAINAFIQYIK